MKNKSPKLYLWKMNPQDVGLGRRGLETNLIVIKKIGEDKFDIPASSYLQKGEEVYKDVEVEILIASQKRSIWWNLLTLSTKEKLDVYVRTKAIVTFALNMDEKEKLDFLRGYAEITDQSKTYQESLKLIGEGRIDALQRDIPPFF